MTEPYSGRLPGHGLLDEGRPYRIDGARDYPKATGAGHGKCSCGELSGLMRTTAARQRWHRDHKAAVVAAREGQQR